MWWTNESSDSAVTDKSGAKESSRAAEDSRVRAWSTKAMPPVVRCGDVGRWRRSLRSSADRTEISRSSRDAEMDCVVVGVQYYVR